MISIGRILRGTAFVAFAVAALLPTLPLSARDMELPTTRVNGREMYYYDTQRGENIYGVAEKLGITRDELVKYNPAAADGLRPHMRLFIPVSEETAAKTTAAPGASSAGTPLTHIVQKGETLYGISRTYNIPVDKLIALNPSTNYGLKAGQRIKLSDEPTATGSVSESAARQSSSSTSTVSSSSSSSSSSRKGNFRKPSGKEGFNLYEIQPDETLYTIAMRNGLTLEELQRYNPDLDLTHYEAGQYVYLPRNEQEPSGDIASRVDDNALRATVGTTPEPDYGGVALPAATGVAPEVAYDALGEYATGSLDSDSVAAAVAEMQTMNVAVMLPFMLRDDDISRQTQLYTEFYKGLLLAADTLRNGYSAPVKFHVYDTANDLDTLRSVLAREEMSDMDLVIAPDNQAQLLEIVNTLPDQTYVMNIFGVRDETYKSHSNIIQTNIPHTAMYENAIEAFIEQYPSAMPVFLAHQGGGADKDMFTSALKQRLDSIGRPYHEITYTQSLSDSDLAGLDPDIVPVVFIPNSGSKNEFAKFVRAITRLHDSAENGDNVQLWGYPEWITFRGDSFDEICNLGATIYSRYFLDSRDASQNELKERYKEVFGDEMFDAVPTQGLLGFDTGVFIITALRELHDTEEFPTEFSGLQTSLRLVDEPGGGLVNDALFLIGFRQGGMIEKIKD